MHKKRNNIITNALKFLYYIAISLVCIIAFMLLYYVISSQIHSKNENYKPTISIYTIVSPSMTPVINVYDVVVNVKVSNPEKIKVGDIITYVSTSTASEGMTITHRVVEVRKDEDGKYEYLTQGDNNSNPDSLYVSFDKVIGKELFIIPKLGKVQFLIANKKTWLLLLLIPIFFFIIKDLYKLIDLLTLKNKVDTITAEEPEPKIDRKKQLKLKEEIIRSHEFDIKEEDYKNTIKPTMLTQKIEILDTDELTSKIKEYDKKIDELNKAIKEYKPDKVEEIMEEDDFLIGKQKVISVQETKNKKRINKNIYKVDETTETKELSKRKITLEELEGKKETPKKDIKVKEIINETHNKPRLNLKAVNKVEENKKENKPAKLNLNPKDIKVINRPGRKRTRKRTKAINGQRKRLIEIRKVK